MRLIVAVTTGITFGCANLIATLATVKGGFSATPGSTIGIYAALLISHGLVNTFGVHILRYLNNSSIILHSLGVGAFAIAVVAKAPTHQSARFVCTFSDRRCTSSFDLALILSQSRNSTTAQGIPGGLSALRLNMLPVLAFS